MDVPHVPHVPHVPAEAAETGPAGAHRARRARGARSEGGSRPYDAAAFLRNLWRPLAGLRVEDLRGDARFAWEERAAIMEYHGGLDRERAEAEALADEDLATLTNAESASGRDGQE